MGEGGFCPVLAWRMNVASRMPPGTVVELVASRQRAGGAGHYCRFLPCVRLRLRLRLRTPAEIDET